MITKGYEESVSTYKFQPRFWGSSSSRFSGLHTLHVQSSNTIVNIVRAPPQEQGDKRKFSLLFR